jgi:hypothetical protein
MKKEKFQQLLQKYKGSKETVMSNCTAPKWKTLEELYKLMDTYNLASLNYEEVENLSSPIVSKEIKSV